jgi:D-alanine--poly(phosphoribitol) ligase subunit 1
LILNNIISVIKQNQNRNAFLIDGNYYSYGFVFQELHRLKNLFIQNNINFDENKLIGIIIDNNITCYASFIYSLISGIGYVPINPLNPLERNKKIIIESGIKYILSNNDKYYEDYNKIENVEVINTSDNPILTNIRHDEEFFEDLKIDENSIAYIIFTSGSTGVPKGTPISRKNLDCFLDSFWNLNLKLNEEDGFLNMSSMTFDMSMITFLVPLCIGACIYIVPEDEIKYLYAYNLILKYPITFIAVVPSTISYFEPYFNEIFIPNIKYSLVCGEAFPIDLADKWQKCIPNAKIINIYGPTEATVFSHYYFYSDICRKNYNGIMAIGYLVKNLFAIILDESGAVLDVNEKGELLLSGDQVFRNYIGHADKNTDHFIKKLIDGTERTFYRTGDIAFKDFKNCFYYVGRKDYQVKIQGHRVELGEVEAAFKKTLNGEKVIAIPVKNNFGNYQIEIFIENEKINKEEIIKFIKNIIPYYMQPSKIHAIKKIPLNANGKIDRLELSKYTNKNM